MTQIQLTDISFGYAQRQILQQINISFAPQKFSVLLGRNGSGKSTLFNLMAGIYPLQSGQIQIAGQALSQLKGPQRARSLGFLAQNHHSIFNFNVLDVVMTGRAAFSGYAPSRQDQQLAYDALATLDIVHLAGRDYSTLSGGERQLVMIARILTQNPQVILLDEPTNHLDVYYQSFLMEKLQLLTLQGYSIVAIMHDANLALLYADDFYFMHQQQVIRVEHRQDIDQALLAQIYGLDFDAVAYQQQQLFVAKRAVYAAKP
jgi:iron complex transport system ATP-binding protein